MGTVFRVPVRRVASLAEALQSLRYEHGVHLVATSPTATRALPEVDLTGDCCIVLGHEGAGIRPEIAALCQDAACIPMPRGVDSLNVASAAAVCLYEASRQRGRT
jgi:tRNA G18 (ribose-2'-O)-methylase SpoU